MRELVAAVEIRRLRPQTRKTGARKYYSSETSAHCPSSSFRAPCTAHRDQLGARGGLKARGVSHPDQVCLSGASSCAANTLKCTVSGFTYESSDRAQFIHGVWPTRAREFDQFFDRAQGSRRGRRTAAAAPI